MNYWTHFFFNIRNVPGNVYAQFSALYIVFFFFLSFHVFLRVAYHDALKKEGIDFKIKTIKGVPHGFWSWPGTIIMFTVQNTQFIPYTFCCSE